MCDQTEVPYLPGDVVWVKLGPVWWPGIVCSNEEVPSEILNDLRKTPIAIVKFFQEDSFEYVKKLTNIYHYNCLRKNDFIKKGLDMGRSKNRDTPSNMKLFPEDVARAEVLTGGNPNILHDEMFQPEERPNYADLFATTKKTPKKIKPEVKKKTPQPAQPVTPRIITHPRFIKLSSGIDTDYEARERKQEPLRAECDEEDNSPPTTYRCPDCDFTTIRLNVIVLHNKSHTRNYASPATGKPTKRKSTSLKFKERMSNEWRSSEVEPVKAKIPKTNGTFVKKSPKTPGRKRGPVAKEVVAKDATKEPKTKPEVAAERPRQSAPQTDQFQESLLEDWAEYEMAEQDAFENDSSISSQQSGRGAPIENSSEAAASCPVPVETKPVRVLEDEKKKSCFDFDDSEDHIVIDKSQIKFGRKIPRVLDPKVEEIKATEPENVEPAADDAKVSSAYERGVDEKYLSDSQSQSQLQEMGVDNEIEINTEEVSSEEVTETSPPIGESVKSLPSDVETETKEKEATALTEKVNQLLEEIAAPSKLPELPRSHKKDRLKEYCQAVRDVAVPESTAGGGGAASEPGELEQPNGSVVCAEDYGVPSTPNETQMEVVESRADERNQVEPNVQTDVQSNLIDNIDSIESIEIGSLPEESSGKETASNETKFIPIPASSATIDEAQTTPTKVTKRAPIRFTTMPQYKTINASQIFNTGPRTVTVIPKMKISAGGTLGAQSPAKTPSTMTFKTADGKSITCTVKHALLKGRTPTTAAAAAPRQVGSVEAKERLASNILQKTPKNAAAAATGKPQTKVVITPGTLQMLMQSQPNKATTTTGVAAAAAESEITSLQSRSAEFVSLTDNSANCRVSTANSSDDQSVELNYVVDESGTLINLPRASDGAATAAAAGNASKKEDILAKALENTDVLQTESGLEPSMGVDSCNPANASATYKTETVYETLTLNTPPIMSAYETPSRALGSTSIADIPNEMIIISGSNENTEYLA